MTELHGYTHFECPECEFTYILRSSDGHSNYCPLCDGDSNHLVHMKSRMATTEDVVEGTDERPK